MAAIRQILCPVDLSDGSRRPLEYAVAIARAWHAHLTVVNVYLTASPFEIEPQPDASAADTSDLEQHRAALQAFVQPVAGDLPVTYRLAHGADPRRPIEDEADAAGADLLIIGTHGKVGVERLLLGSKTDVIVRTAPCPVLVVPFGAASAFDGRFRRILCGIDFSAPSIAAFRFALLLADRTCARVTVLHVIEKPPELQDRQIAAAFDVEAVRAGAEAAARHRLAALSPGTDAPPARVTAKVGEGIAHRQILTEARELRADIIVVGARRRHAVDRWLFGSETAAVLRDASCPVLVVRPD